jgi:hypothetical protein
LKYHDLSLLKNIGGKDTKLKTGSGLIVLKRFFFAMQAGIG